jgi:hypothetical protein
MLSPLLAPLFAGRGSGEGLFDPRVAMCGVTDAPSPPTVAQEHADLSPVKNGER